MARTPKDVESASQFPVYAPIRDLKGTLLQWYQPRSLRRYHELSDGNRLYASLEWLKVFGSLAKIESSEGSFTLKRAGFLSPFVTVRDLGYDTDFAVLRPNFFSGGTLRFSDGTESTFTSARFWGFEWSFRDRTGALICSIRLRSALKNAGDVVIGPGVKRDKRLMVMIGAAYYAMVMANEEAAIPVAVAST